MAISAGDLTLLRGNGQVVKPHLNVVPKINLGTALVNAPIGFFETENEIPIDNVSLNGGLTVDALPHGAMVWVGTSAGDNDVHTNTVSYTVAATTDRLFVGAFGRGDPGTAQAGQYFQNISDNDNVTLFGNMPLWSLLSFIQGGVFYKAYDVPYTDEGSDPDPVCNIGRWRRVVLSGASVDVQMDGSDSFAWAPKTISSYSWSNRNDSWATTGASVIGGAGTATPTFRFTAAGFYVIICTTTDSTGKTHTAYTYYWIVDGVNEKDLTGWVVTNDTQNRQGRRMTIQMTGDQAESVIFPGTAFLYSETVTCGGSSLSDGAVVDSFVGWIDDEKGVRRTETGLVEFDLISPRLVLDQIAAAPQYIQEVAVPDDWTEVTDDLSHPNGVAWYILQHHAPNMLRIFDFIPLDEAVLRDVNWLFNKNSIGGQLSEIATVQVNIGCISSGGLYLRYDPQLFVEADRAALDVQMLWLAEDLRGDDPMEYPKKYRLETGMVDGYVAYYDSGNTYMTAIWKRAPSDAQAQGPRKQVVNSFIGAGSGPFDVDNAGEVTGNLFARANNRTPALALKVLRGTMDTADPALMIWHELTLAAALDPRGEGYAAQRLLPAQVTRNWERVDDDWLKRISITFEVATSGQDAPTKVPDTDIDGSWFPTSEWPVVGDFPAEEPFDPVAAAVPVRAIACHYHSSKVALAYEASGFPGSTPSWVDISTGVSGDCRWMAGDPFDAKRYYLATTDGVYLCNDILATTPTWAKIHDTTGLTGIWASNGWHFIAMTPARQGFIIVVNGEGVIDVSYDGGDSWQRSNTNINTNTVDYLSNVAISDQSTFSDSYIYYREAEFLYASDDWGQTWVAIATDADWPGGNSFGCGMCLVPYIETGGTVGNIPDATQQMFMVDGYRVIGASRGASVLRSNTKGTAPFGTTAFYPIALGNYGGWWSPAMRSVMYNTLDANYMHVASRETAGVNWKTRIYYSTNNLVAATIMVNQPSVPDQADYCNINGWPYNNQFVLAWWKKDAGTFGGIKVTDDNGATAWTDIQGDLVSGGTFADLRIAYAEMMLVDFT